MVGGLGCVGVKLNVVQKCWHCALACTSFNFTKRLLSILCFVCLFIFCTVCLLALGITSLYLPKFNINFPVFLLFLPLVYPRDFLSSSYPLWLHGYKSRSFLCLCAPATPGCISHRYLHPKDGLHNNGE